MQLKKLEILPEVCDTVSLLIASDLNICLSGILSTNNPDKQMADRGFQLSHPSVKSIRRFTHKIQYEQRYSTQTLHALKTLVSRSVQILAE